MDNPALLEEAGRFSSIGLHLVMNPFECFRNHFESDISQIEKDFAFGLQLDRLLSYNALDI